MPDDFPTNLRNPGDPDQGRRAAGEHAALARLGLLDVEPGEPRKSVALRPLRTQAGLRADQLGRLTSRPEWHGLATPPEVEKAWGRVLDLAGEVRRAYGDVSRLDADRRAEQQGATAAARKALDAGEEPAAVEATDWASEELNRQSRWAAVSGQLRQAHADYLAAAQKALPQWQKRVTDLLPKLHEQAREAVAAVVPAVSAWRAAVSAAGELERQRDEQRLIRNTAHKTEAARRALAGGDTSGLVALVSSDDPIVTGSWIAAPDDEMDPPRHVRRAMAESNNTVQHLAFIEAEERYQLTSFTRTDWEHLVPAPDNSPARGGAYGWTA